MIIQYMSDLHLEYNKFEFVKAKDAEVLVLAGDLDIDPVNLRTFIESIVSGYPELPIVMVLGNHDYDNKYFHRVVSMYKGEFQHLPTVHLLECESFKFKDVTFMGATLWTDMAKGKQVGEVAKLREFSQFWQSTNHLERHLHPTDLMYIHENTLHWMESAWPGPKEKVVVVTHMAPSFLSQSPQFSTSPITGYFCSNLEAKIKRWKPKVWIHGHLHDSCRYNIGGTVVTSNPRGYSSPGYPPENQHFNPTKTIEV